MQYYAIHPGTQELEHFGILGMKWGIRRYQNKDGTLTAAGRARQGLSNAGKTVGKAAKATGKAAVATGKTVGKAAKATGKGVNKARDAYGEHEFNRQRAKEQNRKEKLLENQQAKKEFYDSAHRQAKDKVAFYQSKKLAKGHVEAEANRAKLANKVRYGAAAIAAPVINAYLFGPAYGPTTAVVSYIGYQWVTKYENKKIDDTTKIINTYIDETGTKDDKVDIRPEMKYKKRYS